MSLNDAMEVVTISDSNSNKPYVWIVPIVVQLTRSCASIDKQDVTNCVKRAIESGMYFDRNPRDVSEKFKKLAQTAKFVCKYLDCDDKNRNEKQACNLKTAYENETPCISMGSTNGVPSHGNQINIWVSKNISDEFDKDIVYLFAHVPK